MPTFIKTGYWDKLSKAPKGYLNLDLITGGGGSATSVTKTEFDALVSSNGLTPGAYYLISGVDVPLYGGTTILIQAATTNTLALAGHGIFYNPKYNQQVGGYGIWNGLTSYAVGETVIWGGRHWTNLSGDDGYSIDKYTLSSDDWAVVPFNSTDYNVVADVIHYDQENDIIIRRKDKYDNDVDGNVQFFTEVASPDGYGLGNPIKDFQWGNGQEDFNTIDYIYKGVQGNYVKDSYLECINFIGGILWYNTLTEGSYIGNNTITNNNSTIKYNTLSNGGNIVNNVFDNYCYINFNILDRSSITTNTLTNSGITENKLYVNSIIGYNNLVSNSRIEYNELYDNGFITNNTLSNTTEGNVSSISKNKLTFTSRIESNTLTENSNIQNNVLINVSKIEGNVLDNSSIDGNSLGDSYITNNTLSGSSSIRGNVINASIFNFSLSGTLTGKEILFITANHSVVSGNISSATIICQLFTKQIFKNSAGATRLGYYNNSDVFTVVNVNA